MSVCLSVFSDVSQAPRTVLGRYVDSRCSINMCCYLSECRQEGAPQEV